MAIKISVTVDEGALKEAKRLRPGTPVSTIVDEALQASVMRMRLTDLLDEMDRRNPMTPEGERAGEELWNRIVSSWTPEPLAHSQKKTKRFAKRSKKR